MASSTRRLSATRWRWAVGQHFDKKLAGLGALVALLFAKKMTKLLRRDSFDVEPHGTDEDVRGAIRSFLAGSITLDDLDSWLVKTTWDNPSAARLAHEAGLLIAEADQGHLEDLAGDLRALIAGQASEIVS